MTEEPKRYFLPCRISKGLFEDERIVEFTVEETTYKTIVDKDDVEEDEAPTEGEWVSGRLQAYIVKRNGGTVLINLPRETTSSGRRLSVPQSLLQTA